MKILRLVVLLAITLFLIYFLNNSHTIGKTPIPPLGHFLDPFNGFLQNSEDNDNPFDFSDEVSFKGLTDDVSIAYDSNYVPHVYAKNNEDLFFAQGFLMAQNRLWQMEFQILAAAGRLSEVLGKNDQYLYFDRLQRRKGMVYGAEKSAERMYSDPQLAAYADAFTAGVNTYIENLDYKSLPLEYKLLGYEPEPWNKMKSALILMYMVDNLTGYDEDVENTNALAILGEDKFNFLFPERIPGLEPTVPTDKAWEFEPLSPSNPDPDYPDITSHVIISKSNPDNGSNNWAVTPEKSATGNALLASDPHLGLNLPSLWMMLHLNSPDINVYGFTFPGALGITIGFNDSISWGFTNAPRDTRDWYRIQFEDESRKRYRYGDSWRETDMKVEEIKIKGHEPFYDTIIFTHHGPVVYDESFTGTEQNLALKWGGHEGSMVQKTLLLLNQANNYEDYRKALQYWDQPPQNVVFASVKGNIAMTVAGNFPLKWEGQGKFIMEGSNPAHEWQGYIPKEHNAFQLNPERGFVSSANQHSVDEEYPYWFYSSTNEYYRNRRINRILSEKDTISIEDMKTLQNDSYSIKAEEILPLMLDSINRGELNESEKEILSELEKWDYFYDPAITAPVYFNAWWDKFFDLLWDEFDSDAILEKPDEYVTIHLLKQDSLNTYIDNRKTNELEDISALTTQSFKAAVQNVDEWVKSSGRSVSWGNYKNTTIRHLARLAPLSRSNIPVPGYGDAVNANTGSHGPSFRMIVNMSSPPEAWGIYPGGQSGNPGSHYYDDQLDEWSRGEYRRLLFPKTFEEASEVAEKTLKLIKE